MQGQYPGTAWIIHTKKSISKNGFQQNSFSKEKIRFEAGLIC